ncbi:unnamed protein product [Hymenolepis diminuta]|uniref:Uncharacterized protein n=1 Tax=Hymenolepis diminuta TaxID=6216 RepID=A0A564Z433_HYMDI|nr:unnamed protein product [Hymenolepis diminuta]
MRRPAEGGFLQVVSKRMTSVWKTNREQELKLKNSILSNCKWPLMKIQPALLEN